MNRQRVLWAALAVLTLLLVGALVAVFVLNWPWSAPPAVNVTATDEAQAGGALFGLTPFTDWAVSIGLCVIGGGLLAALAATVWVRFVSSAPRRLSWMIQPRLHRPEPRTLEDLIEHLIEAQNRQYAEIMRRLDALESGARSADPIIIPPRRRPEMPEAEDNDSQHRRQAASSRPTWNEQPPRSSAPPPPDHREVVASLEHEYRSLLGECSAAQFREFFQRRNGFGLEAGADCLRRGGGEGALVMAVPVGSGKCALFPGYDVISDFGTVYYAQRSMPDEVKLAFNFEVDGSRVPKLGAAGRASPGDDGGYSVDQRGRLAGLAA